MKRIKIWHVGILLSIIWIIAVGISTHRSNVEDSTYFAKYSYRECLSKKLPDVSSDLSSCERERDKTIAEMMKGRSELLPVYTLAPLPFFWLLSFLMIYFVRAQIVGFRSVVPWSTLNRWKKAFVIFCGASTALLFFFILLGFSNFYVDSKVPVVPASYASVFKISDNAYVSAQGTWIRTDLNEELYFVPLQTTRIQCRKEVVQCTEARAVVSGNSLSAELYEHEVESWTNSSIVLRDDGTCVTERFTIDLVTNTVSGTGRFKSENKNCKQSSETWSYRLADGFSVYWELRKKHRPLILRLTAALFGGD